MSPKRKSARWERIVVWAVFSGALLFFRIKAGITWEFILTLAFYTMMCAQNEFIDHDLFEIRKELFKIRRKENFDFNTVQVDDESDCPPDDCDKPEEQRRP